MTIRNWIKPSHSKFVFVSQDDWLDTTPLEKILSQADISFRSMSPMREMRWSKETVDELVVPKDLDFFVVVSSDIEPFSLALTTKAVEAGYVTYLVIPTASDRTIEELFRALDTGAKVASFDLFVEECRFGLELQ